jgi:hypothetical protein
MVSLRLWPADPWLTTIQPRLALVAG